MALHQTTFISSFCDLLVFMPPMWPEEVVFPVFPPVVTIVHVWSENELVTLVLVSQGTVVIV